MSDTTRWFLVLGAGAMAVAVALGAFGAHALRARLAPEQLAVWTTAVQYHALHALGLLAVAGVAHLFPQSNAVRGAGWLLFAGTLLFSGSLYLLVLSGARWLGAVTPLGGAAFIAGWVLLAVGVWRG